MFAMLIRAFLVISIFVLVHPSSSMAAEQRIALVIGNSAYSSGPLKNPVNDSADIASMLEKLGFSVTLRQNAGLQEMEEAIEAFGNRLKRGGVGLFYYAGHGVQVNGVNYLLPVRAKINKEADVKYQAVDANKILDEMAAANNGLNIVLLDACRDNPFARSFRSATRGLAIVSSAPSGTFISYSTSPGNVARDGDGRNSPYTAALLQYMQVGGLTLSDVFINVRTKVKKETGQVPWELSSLEGQFYFLPGDLRKSGDSGQSAREVVKKEKSPAAVPDLKEQVPPININKQSPYFRVMQLAGGHRYEGEFRDDNFNGQGILIFASGDRYEGEFRNGKRNGRGILSYANGYRYDGEFRDDNFNGRGILIYATGERYDGEFRDGKSNGQGTLTYANGNRYQGGFLNAKFHGQGIFLYATGDRYEGGFLDGKRSGRGTLTYAKGYRYDGEFRDDKFHGQGIFIYASGDRYEGEYLDGRRNGRGTFTFADGRVLKGLWKNDAFERND